jgi:hypothetical protein
MDRLRESQIRVREEARMASKRDPEQPTCQKMNPLMKVERMERFLTHLSEETPVDLTHPMGRDRRPILQTGNYLPKDRRTPANMQYLRSVLKKNPQ